MEKLIPPPPARLLAIKNPYNDEMLKVEPLFLFIEKYGEDANYAANVIEFTANEEDAKNPKLDLSYSTDLLRHLAKCLREMAE